MLPLKILVLRKYGFGLNANKCPASRFFSLWEGYC
jgi:hypothetical protein